MVAYLKDGSFDGIDLPDLEDIDRVAHSLGVCLSAFSKKPFDEKWSIDGLLSPGLLLNPRTTSHLVKKLFRHDECIIKVKPDGGEQFTVKTELILDHLKETLNDPMTGFLLDTGWFTLSDIDNLKYVQNELINKKLAYTIVDMVYPLTELLGKYVDATKGFYSMLSLGYHETWEYNPISTHNHQNKLIPSVSSEFKLLRITPDTVVPYGIYPRFTGRYLNINHPCDNVIENAIELAIKETTYYLNDDEQNLLRKIIDPDLYTTFFGEISKIPDTDSSISGMLQSGIKYLEIVTQPNSSTVSWELKDLLPKQLLYMSLPGTAVASKSKLNPTDSKLLQAIKLFYEPCGLEYKEEVLTFTSPGRKTVLFGIIRQV